LTVSTPAISIVVPVKDAARRLERCLASICASEGISRPPEIIVVDNGSSDDSADVGRRFGATVISAPGVRVSEARNLGVARSQGDAIAFVDADIEVDRQWLGRAVARLSDAIGVGAAYHAPAPGTWVQRVYDGFRPRPPTAAPTGWLPAGGLVVRRSEFEAVGGFDTTLEACEDVDLCERLAARGVLLHDPELVAIHHGDPPTLKALFLGELWRGRDNLRVSLRPPIRLTSLPSVVIPVVVLAAFLFALLGPLAGSVSLAQAGSVFAVALGGAAVLRAPRIWLRLPTRSVVTGAQALAVSLVYELARALALVARVPHAWRRGSSVQTAGK
jgi:hypothetical protein